MTSGRSVKKWFLLLGRRWLDLIPGQRKFIVVASLLSAAVFILTFYVLSKVVPTVHVWMTFRQFLSLQIVMLSASFLTIIAAAHAAKRHI